MRVRDFLFFVLASGLSATTLMFLVPIGESNSKRIDALLPWGSGGVPVIVLLFVMCLCLTVLTTGVAIRRITPKVPLKIWCAGWFVYCVVLLLLFISTLRFRQYFPDIGRDYLAERPWVIWHGIQYGFDAIDLVPFGAGLLLSFLVPFVCWMPTVFMLFLREKSWRFPLVFNFAMAFGNLANTVARVVFAGCGFEPDDHRFASEGLDSLDNADFRLLTVLFLSAVCGGVVSSFVLQRDNTAAVHQSTWMTKPKTWAATVLALCFLGPVAVSYATGRSGWSAGFPAVQKFFTSAPRHDNVEGRAVLTRIAETDSANPSFWPNRTYDFIAFEPDSLRFLSFDSERRLVRHETKTGHLDKVITDSFSHKNFNPELGWTSDNRLMLVRTAVELDDDKFGVKGREWSRVRVFSVPDYTLIADEKIPFACGTPDGNGALLAIPGQRAFVIRCVGYRGNDKNQPELVLAKVGSTISFEKLAHFSQEQTNPISGLLLVKQDILAVRSSYKETDPLWIESVMQPGKTFMLEKLRDPSAGGKMTYQFSKLNDGFLEVRLCGDRASVNNPPQIFKFSASMKWFCRSITYDAMSGTWLRQVDVPQNLWRENSITIEKEDEDFIVESAWKENSKTGTLRVLSPDSRSELQKITTANQNAIAISPDGKWLVTLAFDQSKFVIYEIDRSALQ